jgi:copper homeostasis protein
MIGEDEDQECNNLELSMAAQSVFVEAAVDTFEGALAAEREGVDRIEVCGPLDEGGTTPATDLITRCVDRLRTPLHVLVRPRAGEFVYTAVEIATMKADIVRAKLLGVHGVVTGALTADGTIDVDVLAELIVVARPMRVCFHRAFDCVHDQFAALEILVSRGCDLVLTSGAAPTALLGADRLRALGARAGDRIGIIAGGSITSDHVREIVARTGVRQVHGRAFRGLPAALRDS